MSVHTGLGLAGLLVALVACGSDPPPPPAEDPYQVGRQFVLDTVEHGDPAEYEQNSRIALSVCQQMAARHPDISIQTLNGCSAGFRELGDRASRGGG